MDKLEIGTEVIGFEFPHHFYNNRKLCFNSSMNSCIGEIGEIIGYDKKANTYSIKFRHELGNWWYPAELVEQHVVKKEKMYSEEEVLDLLRKSHFVEQNIEEWFEQHKKK